MMMGDRMAGRTKEIKRRPSQSKDVIAALVPAAISEIHPVNTPICPTRPQVPMPEETAAPSIRSLKTQVASGPVMAEAKMGPIQMRGFLTMLGICSMDVPRP